MSEEWVVTTPAQLAQIIDGRSDEEINEGLEALGIDTALDKVFEGMVDAFDADKAEGQTATVQWDISTPDGTKSYHVIVKDGKCETGRGTAESPRVTLSCTVPDFLRVVTGKVNGTQAFFTGKLKLTGDMMFAQVQQNWFKIVGGT
jgi:putative sterol carrier protein